MIKNRNKFKISIIIITTFIAFLIVSFITIGYASFSTNFAINGSLLVKNDNDIRITNVSVKENNGVTEYSSPAYTKSTLSDNISLESITASITYDVTVTNLSSFDVMLTGITKKTWSNSNIQYTLSGIDLNSTKIKSTESYTFQVKITFNNSLLGIVFDILSSGKINFVLGFDFYKMEKYTLTVNCIPDDALIVFESDGSIVNTGNGSISSSFSKSSVVKWSVSKDGYATQSQTLTMTGDITKDIMLSEAESYTFSLNPNPSDALVTLKVNGNIVKTGYGPQSVVVSSNTSVNYIVSKFMYNDVENSYTVLSNYTLNVTLTSLPAAPNYWYTSLNPTLLYKIKNSETIGTPSTTPGQALSSSSESVFASALDDYGTTYYYRGGITNNYVSFANMCWRIVRVVGNGSIKLVLYNNSSSSCATTGSSLAFIPTKYAFNSSKNNNAYVGLMYGSTSSSATYLQTHTNSNYSTILSNLESWYSSKFLNTDYESKLEDSIWCNDKSISSSSSKSGANTSYTTYYSAYSRIGSTITFMCPSENSNLSRFTVDDITYGNGNLKYKIGLLTVDETSYAGSYTSGFLFGSSNTSYYLYQNASAGYWWTLSPYSYGYNSANIYTVNGSGCLTNTASSTTSYIRPSITLKHDVEVSSGNGSASNPYVIN